MDYGQKEGLNANAQAIPSGCSGSRGNGGVDCRGASCQPSMSSIPIWILTKILMYNLEVDPEEDPNLNDDEEVDLDPPSRNLIPITTGGNLTMMRT